jgi:hypothetical protein
VDEVYEFIDGIYFSVIYMSRQLANPKRRWLPDTYIIILDMSCNTYDYFHSFIREMPKKRKEAQDEHDLR